MGKLLEVVYKIANDRRETEIKENPVLKPFINDIEKSYGRIKEIHDESSRFNDSDYVAISTYFKIVTDRGLITVILSKDGKQIKEIHKED